MFSRGGAAAMAGIRRSEASIVPIALLALMRKKQLWPLNLVRIGFQRYLVDDLLTNREQRVSLVSQSQPFQTGFQLVMRVPQEELDPHSLRLEGENWRVVGSDGKLVKDFPYMVFEVSGTKEKHDWAKIAELKRQYDLIKDAIVRGDLPEANAGHKVFGRMARTSLDLIEEDGKSLTDRVRGEIDRCLGATKQQASSGTTQVKEFDQLDLYPS
jgi:hypothetical protein